jgi:hypothetical protein
MLFLAFDDENEPRAETRTTWRRTGSTREDEEEDGNV